MANYRRMWYGDKPVHPEIEPSRVRPTYTAPTPEAQYNTGIGAIGAEQTAWAQQQGLPLPTMAGGPQSGLDQLTAFNDQYKKYQNVISPRLDAASKLGVTDAAILQRLRENEYKYGDSRSRSAGKFSAEGQAHKDVLLEMALQDEINKINAQFSSLGRYGSPEHMKAIARAESGAYLNRSQVASPRIGQGGRG